MAYEPNENYTGKTLLKNWWGIVKQNFAGVKQWTKEHINGIADRHDATQIDYAGEVDNASTAAEALDTLNANLTKGLQKADEALQEGLQKESEERKEADSQLGTEIKETLETSKIYTDQSIADSIARSGLGFWNYGRTLETTSFPVENVPAGAIAFDFTTNTEHDWNGTSWIENEEPLPVQKGTSITVIEMLDGMDITGVPMEGQKVEGVYNKNTWEFAVYKASSGGGFAADNDTLNQRQTDGAFQVADQQFDITEDNTKFTSNALTSFKQFWQSVLNKINAIFTALTLKANIESPKFTGTPTAPMPEVDDNSMQIATTSFVKDALELKADIESPEFTGIPKSTTPTENDNSTQIATTEFVAKEIIAKTKPIIGEFKLGYRSISGTITNNPSIVNVCETQYGAYAQSGFGILIPDTVTDVAFSVMLYSINGAIYFNFGNYSEQDIGYAYSSQQIGSSFGVLGITTVRLFKTGSGFSGYILIPGNNPQLISASAITSNNGHYLLSFHKTNTGASTDGAITDLKWS